MVHGLLLSLAVIMRFWADCLLPHYCGGSARAIRKKHPESGESGGIPCIFAVLHGSLVVLLALYHPWVEKPPAALL
ncbi:hypothetical protein KCP71_24600 [Salmonella enterica subsp. enterica]|nr:hypothetical protein KCP71_24600 [Salmonella enterica subsp. enterica]